jgi:hypothetical protein
MYTGKCCPLLIPVVVLDAALDGMEEGFAKFKCSWWDFTNVRRMSKVLLMEQLQFKPA